MGWQEETGVYNSVMATAGEALMHAAGQLLAPENARQLDYDGDADEFGQYLCETMAGFGTSHLHTLAPDKKILFLQQVLPSASVSEDAAHAMARAHAEPLWRSFLCPLVDLQRTTRTLLGPDPN